MLLSFVTGAPCSDSNLALNLALPASPFLPALSEEDNYSFGETRFVCMINNAIALFLISAKTRATLFPANSSSCILARDLQYRGQD